LVPVPTTDTANPGTEETLVFIERHVQGRSAGSGNAPELLPGTRSDGLARPLSSFRLLEVGCGKGHLAAALASKGLYVRGVDVSEEAIAETRARGIDCIQADFLAYEDKPFDILLFARSLHHISPVDLTVEKAAALLMLNGVLLVEDFGADRADAAALSWLAQKKSKAMSVGLCQNTDRHQEATSGSLEKWKSYYYEKHRIADSQIMLKAVQRVFSDVQVETAPYLYRYLLDIVGSGAAGLAFIQDALEEEKSLIAEDKIAAVGWRLACRRERRE
jgi:2-polyprenyl-3-methyl-5-hydroxy-6-metoxy-1,4-benzoquinol methylase